MNSFFGQVISPSIFNPDNENVDFRDIQAFSETTAIVMAVARPARRGNLQNTTLTRSRYPECNMFQVLQNIGWRSNLERGNGWEEAELWWKKGKGNLYLNLCAKIENRK